MGMARGRWRLHAVAWVFALMGSPHPAFAQPLAMATTRPYSSFVELNVDAGLALEFHDSRRHWLGAAATGLGLFNGNHVWEFTVGLRDTFKESHELTFALARLGVESGLGLHAEGLWSFSDGAVGAGAGLSLSILNLEGVALFDASRTKQLLLFLRVPLGLIVHAMRERAQ